MASPAAGTKKMLAKMEASVRSGSFYEAEQLCKSVSARYLSQGRFEDALDLLQSGAQLQLEHQQVNAGVELGKLLLEAMDKAKLPFSTALLDRVLAVYRGFVETGAARTGPETVGAAAAADEPSTGEDLAKPTAQAVQGAIQFLKAALRWSMRVEGGAKMGAPELHDAMAQCFWEKAQHKDIGMAAQHFVLGTSPQRFAAALEEIMDQCFPDEIDLVAARGVFQYLAIGNLRGANALLEALQSPTLLPSRQEPPPALPDSPLMHFIAFLLLTLERDAYPLFHMLRTHYQPSIDRDPSFDGYLDDIAQKFYGVRKQQGGFLGDLMQMLMGPDS